jgi:hypothetical protein
VNGGGRRRPKADAAPPKFMRREYGVVATIAHNLALVALVPHQDTMPHTTALVLRQEVPEQRSRLSGGRDQVITSWAERAMRAVRSAYAGSSLKSARCSFSRRWRAQSPRSSRCAICSSRAPASSRRRPTWATEAADQALRSVGTSQSPSAEMYSSMACETAPHYGAVHQCGGSPTGSPGATVTLRRHVLPHGRWHDDRGGTNPTAGTTWSTGRSRSGSAIHAATWRSESE